MAEPSEFLSRRCWATVKRPVPCPMAMACAPYSAFTCLSFATILSRASSQVILTQPGSASPFGRVRVRVVQTFAMIEVAHRGEPLGAEGSLVDVVRVALDLHDLSMPDMDEHAALDMALITTAGDNLDILFL